MTKNSTTFGTDKQPQNRRSRSFKTKLLEVIKKESLIGASPNTNDKAAEQLYITHLAKRAFDIDDPASATLSKELISKSYPSLKSTMPTVAFDFSPETTPLEQASQILKAASDGLIPPDVAQIFIVSISSMMKIQEITDFAERLEEIEKLMGIGNA